jgi:hypothetical protein
VGFSRPYAFLAELNIPLSSKVGANKTHLITQTSSLGMWVPVHDDEWDGDFPLSLDKPVDPDKDCDGVVVFKGNALPWQVGRYEVTRFGFALRIYS